MKKVPSTDSNEAIFSESINNFISENGLSDAYKSSGESVIEQIEQQLSNSTIEVADNLENLTGAITVRQYTISSKGGITKQIRTGQWRDNNLLY